MAADDAMTPIMTEPKLSINSW